MASMDARYNRVAMLKQAERRSQFAATIEKYETKLRQDQKTRTLHRLQRPATAATTSEQFVQKMSLPDRVKGLSENKVIKSEIEEEKEEDFKEDRKPIQQYLDETKDLLQGKAVPERAEIPSKQLNTFAISKGKAVSINSGGRNVPLFGSAEEINSLAENSSKLIAAKELNVSAIAAALKIRLKAADMSAPMQEHAFRCARETMESLEKLHCKRVAFALKKEFDKCYGPAWHCIVGTSFGSFLTHSAGGFIYFSIDKVSVLLFKTTVEPI